MLIINIGSLEDLGENIPHVCRLGRAPQKHGPSQNQPTLSPLCYQLAGSVASGHDAELDDNDRTKSPPGSDTGNSAKQRERDTATLLTCNHINIATFPIHVILYTQTFYSTFTLLCFPMNRRVLKQIQRYKWVAQPFVFFFFTGHLTHKMFAGIPFL